MQQNRQSTYRNYRSVWKKFNEFIINLDVKPKYWEDRATLFIGYLIDKGYQSSTIKSYVSAIKRTLVDDKYEWEDSKILLTSLTRACKLKNDCVTARRPIYCSLLELILFEVERIFRKKNQFYLEVMYKALFCLGYYGLMRVGELTESPHTAKAKDVLVGTNKDNIMIILFSSKTHGKGDRSQKIKTTSNVEEKSGHYRKRNFCPFELLRNYFAIRREIEEDNENFFIFNDGTAVMPHQARAVLNEALDNIGLESDLYDMHSLRIGRASDYGLWLHN